MITLPHDFPIFLAIGTLIAIFLLYALGAVLLARYNHARPLEDVPALFGQDYESGLKTIALMFGARLKADMGLLLIAVLMLFRILFVLAVLIAIYFAVSRVLNLDDRVRLLLRDFGVDWQ
jgi:hypothetical protein